MGLLKNIFSTKSTPAFDNDLSTYGAWSNVWNEYSTIQSLSHDQLLRLYKTWVFDACDAIGDGLKMLDFALFKSKKRQDKIRENPILDKLDPELIKGIAVFLKTLGAAYIYKEVVGGKIFNLLLLNTGNVIEIKDSCNKIIGYQYTDGGCLYDFTLDDIIKIETFSPVESDSGMTPLKAVANQVAMDLAAVEFNKLFFENGGRPGTVLSHEKKIKKEEKEAFIAKWKANFIGLKNAHKVAFLDNGIKVDDLSSTQKDMDLTNQRTFTMDEVLMAFRVSKPILGKADGVGFADRKVPGYYFNEYTLKPLAKLIQDTLNQTLFQGLGYFAFIFPQDKDDLQKEYISGLITFNEYRAATSKPLIENGNVLFNGEEVQFEGIKVNERKKGKILELESSIFKSLTSLNNKSVFGSEEYNEGVRKTKITRTDKYEDGVSKIQSKIFNEQEKEILKNLEKTGKDVKVIKDEDDLFDGKTSKILYNALYTPFFKRMMNLEGNIALNEITEAKFDITLLNKWIGENVDRMADDIDDTTKKEIFKIIKQGNEAGIGADAISVSIRQKFNQYKKKDGRVDKIARTEVTRASNKSQEEAYEQSGVVEQKEWFTALDDRVAPECQILHGKKVKIGESYLKKGETDALGNKVTYETVDFPPRHVNCRCTLRPIISRKCIDSVSNILSKKGIKFNINK